MMNMNYHKRLTGLSDYRYYKALREFREVIKARKRS